MSLPRAKPNGLCRGVFKRPSMTVDVMQIVASERRLMLQNRHRNHHRMIFPQLAQFTDVALLLLRVMVGIVFFTSGWNDLKDPDARSKDIGMSKGFTIFLGA